LHSNLTNMSKQKESQLQSECVKWFRYQYPTEIIYAIPNGGSRNIIEAVNFKKQGTLKGVPDLCIIKGNSHYNGCYIEMKVGANKMSLSQSEMALKIAAKGYLVLLVYDFDTFKAKIDEYLKIK